MKKNISDLQVNDLVAPVEANASSSKIVNQNRMGDRPQSRQLIYRVRLYVILF
jgi:hypothetical protein